MPDEAIKTRAKGVEILQKYKIGEEQPLTYQFSLIQGIVLFWIDTRDSNGRTFFL